MSQEIKTSYALALILTLFLGFLTFINWADRQAGLISRVSPSSQLAALEGADSGLVGWWKFDEGSGTTAGDSAGSNTGTLINGPTWVTGKVGSGALSFDGVDDNIDYSTILHGTVHTFSAWVYQQNASNGIIIYNNSDIGQALRITTNGTQLMYSTSGGEQVSVWVSPISGSWWHYTVVRNGTAVTFYQNGVQVGTTQTLASNDTLTTRGIGGVGAVPFKGSLDDVRIYNRALSLSEVTQLYNYTGGSPQVTPNPTPTPPVTPSSSSSYSPTPTPTPTHTPNLNPAPLNTTEWYVSPTGLSTGNGTKTNPWDLQMALNGASGAIKPGHTVWLRGGTYHGKFISTLSGTSAQPIIVRNYNNEKVIINDDTAQFQLAEPITLIPSFSDRYYVRIKNGGGWPLGNSTKINGKVLYLFNPVIEKPNPNGVLYATTDLANNPASFWTAIPVGTPVFKGGCLIAHTGNYTWFWGLEMTSVKTERFTDPSFYPCGLNLLRPGIGNKSINMVVYNVDHPAIGFWDQSDGGEVYGDILWGNGVYDSVGNPVRYPDGWIRGDGIYADNQDGNVLISDVIAFRNFTTGMKCYGEGAGHCNGFTFDGNVAFDETDGIFAATAVQPVDKLTLKNNNVYNANFSASYLAKNNQEAVVTGNYIAVSMPANYSAGVFGISEYIKVTVRDNIFYNFGQNAMMTGFFVPAGFDFNTYANYSWDYNKYYGGDTFYAGHDPRLFTNAGWDSSPYGAPGWKNLSDSPNWEKNSTDSLTDLPEDKIIIRPNKYEQGRANIVVWNWTKKASTSVNLSSSGLLNGDTYKILDAQNYLGAPVASGVYSSASPSVTLPLNLTAVSPITGNIRYSNTHTPREFNVFVLLKTASGGGTPTPISGSCSTTVNMCAPGTFSDVTDTTFNSLWSCQGSNGGTTASCSLPISAPDTTAPVLSSITATALSTSAAILWTTNEPATTQVQYGLTTAYGNSTAVVYALTTSHTNNLTSLTPNTIYHYRVISRDGASNTATSSDQVFTTSNSTPTDSDGDGILNTADACPNTPAGTAVNSSGCPLYVPPTPPVTPPPAVLPSLNANPAPKQTTKSSPASKTTPALSKSPYRRVDDSLVPDTGDTIPALSSTTEILQNRWSLWLSSVQEALLNIWIRIVH
jgi:hypothetical protein